MKKYLKFMFVIMLIIPFAVSADAVDEPEVVAQTIKYFKTTTIFNNSSVMRNGDMGEMTSLTTEITKEEFDNADITSDNGSASPLNYEATTETTYKRLTTSIENNGATYSYVANLYWKNIPKVRSYDIIGIGHYNDVELFADGFVGFNQDYCTSTTNCYTSSSGTDIITEYGTAVVFKVPSGTLVSLEQTLDILMTKAVSWTITEQSATGDYAHATKTISQSTAANAVYIDTQGLVISSSVQTQYYDTTPAVRVYWHGSW